MKKEIVEQGNVIVFSKKDFIDFIKYNNIDSEFIDLIKNRFAFISINDSDGDYFHKPIFDKDYDNFITLYFDDITSEDAKSPTNKGKTKMFSIEDAKKIVSFVKKNCGKNFIVHCAAGISRSGAVGTFINDFCQYNYENFRNNNRGIIPNQFIYSTLKKVSNV